MGFQAAKNERPGELETARIDFYLEAVQAAEAEIRYKQAVEQERARADALASQVAAVQAELKTARSRQAPAADTTQALKRELDQERGNAAALARELDSARNKI
jgi:hypothetical protein